MSFFDDVKQAWGNSDQARLMGLMRLDYSNDMWEQKSPEFLAASEEAQVQPVRLFNLAKQVQEKLIGNKKLRWQLLIIPHLLNLYQGKDFDTEQWVVAAADGNLPESAWEDIKTWVAEWVKGRLRSKNFSNSLGFFDVRTEGAGRHRPGIFHPLVLRIAQEVMNPAEAFTLEMAKWLFNNAVKSPVAGAIVGTGFAAGATVLKLAESQPAWEDLSQKLLTTFEENCLCDETAPDVWKNKEAQVQLLLDACPFWRSAKTAAELRRRAYERLERLTADIKENFSGDAIKALPSFHIALRDAAHFPLPEYRSDSAGYFWEDAKFNNLTTALTAIGSTSNEFAEHANSAAIKSADSSAVFASFSKVAAAPVCRAALPELNRNGNSSLSKGFAARMVLNRQMRFVRISGPISDSFPFVADSGFLADAPGWIEAVHTAAPKSDAAVTLSSWLALEQWDALRGRCIVGRDETAALLKYVENHELFTLLASATPDLLKLPVGDSLKQLRQRLAMLALVGTADWQNLLKNLTECLDKLAAKQDTEAYLLLSAARLELSVTAAAAGASPAAALGATGVLTDLNAFNGLLDIATNALSSEKAWEARAGFNAYILLMRLVELTGDLFIAHQLSVSMNERAKQLVQASIKNILENRPLTGSDLPLAFAASDLTRFARERGMGIAETELIDPPAWWHKAELSKLLHDLTAQFSNEAVCKQLADTGGLGLRLLLLTIMQMQLDLFERGRRLLVRPPQNVESGGLVGLKTLHDLRHALSLLFCPEPLLRLGLPADANDDVPWQQPEYWFRRSVGTEAPPLADQAMPALQIVNWLDSWQDQAQTNALGRAAWLSASVPKRLPDNLPSVYRKSIYSSELLRDIDGCYEGEMPHETYAAVRKRLDGLIEKMGQQQQEFVKALLNQRTGQNNEEIRNLLSEKLRLDTSNFREQILAKLADVRQAEAELEVAEHESLAAEFEVAANRMLTEAAGFEVERAKLDTKITELGRDIKDKDKEIADIGKRNAANEEEKAANDIEKAKLIIRQTEVIHKKAQAQLEGIQLEIEFIKKVIGDSNKPSYGTREEMGQYGVEIELNGNNTFANGQMAAIALRTEVVLLQQITKQKQEAKAAKAAAEKEEEKARKKAKRNKLITSVCSFIGSVVGSIYGGPAGAALGAEIGKAVAELAIGVMDNKPPMDILTGLVDNAFAIADKAGYNLEAELNNLGGKVAGEIGAYMKDIEGKIKPLLADMPQIFDAKMMQGALEVLGLEELGDASGLSKALFQGITNDLDNLGQIGTTLKGASGLERAKDLETHLKKHLIEKADNAWTDIRGLAGRVGEQIENLTGDDPAARRKVLERVMDKVTPLVTGAIATQAGQFRQRKITEWISERRSENRFWNDKTVQNEGRKLLEQLFPDNKEVSEKAAANMAQALLPPQRNADDPERTMLYRGKIQQHLAPYQKEQDSLIKEILDHEPKASGSGSAFWESQVNYLKGVEGKFTTKLFPFMKGETANHPRVQLIINLDQLKQKAEEQKTEIEKIELQGDIDNISLDNAKLILANAENNRKKAELFFQNAELYVEQASLMMKIAEISFKKAGTLEEAQKQAENAAKARAAAAKAKIKAAKANLEGKQALLNGARRFGIEAGRVRSALDRPVAVLDTDAPLLNRARREYSDSFCNAMIAYREMVRYCLTTFFSENGQDGTKLPEFFRPDLLTADNNMATWHGALTAWCGKIDSEMRDRKPRRSVTPESFQWDLTLEQIAALASPSGLLLQIGPHISQEEPLLEIPAEFVQKGTISKEAFKFFQEKKFPLTEKAKFILDGLQWRIFDQAQAVSVALYRADGRLLIRKDVRADNDPKAYALADSPDSDKLFHLMYWPDRFRGDRQRPETTGRSMPSDRYTYKLFQSHANGRIIALFVEVRDDGGNPVQSADFAIQATFTGNQWIDRNKVQLQPPADLISFRIIEDENVVSDRIELGRRFSDVRQDLDGDMDMSFVQGTPIAGTTKLKLLVGNNSLGVNKTIGSVRIAVLYKHYSSN